MGKVSDFYHVSLNVVISIVLVVRGTVEAMVALVSLGAKRLKPFPSQLCSVESLFDGLGGHSINAYFQVCSYDCRRTGPIILLLD